MFSSISWQEYWISLLVITLAYYLVIYLLSFQKRVINLETSTKEATQPVLFEIDQADIKQTEKESEEYIIRACLDELNAFFENQRTFKPVKRELMHGLYSIFQKYPSLVHSEYKESITHVIATQCENICSIHLSAEELRGVWFG